MKKYIFLLLLVFIVSACKNESKTNTVPTEAPTQVEEQMSDTIASQDIETIAPKKSAKDLIAELKAKGFSITSYIDDETKDTIIKQQYFMVFFKKGPIRGQPEEETAVLHKEHLEYLDAITTSGYTNILGSFDDDRDIKGMAIYNVPTLKMADSLAHADPMVKSGQLEIEIHPWWAKKGVSLH